ncbi:hypothetical protein FQR65_LT15198 [Abscondita terminalis]|nr:hypothetical protein FQR65_LT15198 [Abscondita terminalis]
MNGQPVAQEKVDYIIEAARLAPTSSGLQPYKIIAISDPELKHANNSNNLSMLQRQAVYRIWSCYCLLLLNIKVDATPMEGLVNEQLDDLLELKKYGP